MLEPVVVAAVRSLWVSCNKRMFWASRLLERDLLDDRWKLRSSAEIWPAVLVTSSNEDVTRSWNGLRSDVRSIIFALENSLARVAAATSLVSGHFAASAVVRNGWIQGTYYVMLGLKINFRLPLALAFGLVDGGSSGLEQTSADNLCLLSVVPMSASLAPECNEVKEYVEINLPSSYLLIIIRKYDTCFLKWYSESTQCSNGTQLYFPNNLHQNTFAAILLQMSVNICSRNTKHA